MLRGTPTGVFNITFAFCYHLPLLEAGGMRRTPRLLFSPSCLVEWPKQTGTDSTVPSDPRPLVAK